MLKAVEIKNFRSCYATKFDFDRSLCAISGRNGVGKSNILKAIEWACESVIVADRLHAEPAGFASEDLDELAVKFRVCLDEQTYEYHLQMPKLVRRYRDPSVPPPDLRESLQISGPDGSADWVFQRNGESIQVTGRPEPIRIPASTPALAALFSLLGRNDPNRVYIERLTLFFSGTRYYSLDDLPDAADNVTEQEYNEWKFRYLSERLPPKSVVLRLIYMWQEDRARFDELCHILGPNGLGVVESIDVLPLVHNSVQEVTKDGAVPQTMTFMPILQPSAHMGGAGKLFLFSNLSVGTRRVIRLITSMLFDKRSLMLMEQPEDSIHPGLLRKLIDQIRTYSFNTQMLFTTHSLEVLDILYPEEVLLATAPGGATEVRKLTPEEIVRAKEFLKNEGALSAFLEPLDDPE